MIVFDKGWICYTLINTIAVSLRHMTNLINSLLDFCHVFCHWLSLVLLVCSRSSGPCSICKVVYLLVNKTIVCSFLLHRLLPLDSSINLTLFSSSPVQTHAKTPHLCRITACNATVMDIYKGIILLFTFHCFLLGEKLLCSPDCLTSS